MSLTPGTRLGPYEVTAQIGAGGMGEVYRATDTNLARQVAIKVLPTAVATDPERLARFDREAKTLASLNHPNKAVERNQFTSCLSSAVRHVAKELEVWIRPLQGPTCLGR